MAFRLKGSHIAAVVIAGGIIGWMATGEVIEGGGEGAVAATAPDGAGEIEEAPFRVRYVELQPQEHVETLTIRGRTAADAVIEVRTETAGTVQERLADKGQKVSAGDLVCRLDAGTRQAAVAEAEAALTQVQFDYDASLKLNERGYAAEARVKSLKAALDAAKARLAQAQQELARVDVHANAAGTVQEPIAEVGDMLRAGDVCVTLVDTDPMLFVGEVSERRVGALETGMEARVGLVSGAEATGTLRFIAPSADAQTRTFSVEIALDGANPDLRAGITATAAVALKPSEAYRIMSSWLSLSDEGAVGVRAVRPDSTVAFLPVEILSQTADAMWVTGLDAGTRVISLGQEFVIEGQKVVAVPDSRHVAGSGTAKPADGEPGSPS